MSPALAHWLAARSPARSWVLLIGYVLAIFASLPFVRGVAIALQRQNLLGGAVTLLYFVAVVAVVYHVVFDVRLSDRIAFLALVLLAAVTGAMILGLSIPEERIHFVQYGLMALLARRALAWHLKPWQQYVGAFLIAAAAGWVDEFIQALLPDRVYDLRDVAINAVAAMLALAADEVLHNRLGWLPGQVQYEARSPDG
ncbi:MAG: VanZ family protein [Thermoanaerobaculia bacterium]